MNITRRHILATDRRRDRAGAPAMAQAAETVRVGLPTKTYWPTTIAETAVRQKLFEKEGITAELTIYRGGAETFEGDGGGRRRRHSRRHVAGVGRTHEGRDVARSSPMPRWAISAGN